MVREGANAQLDSGQIKPLSRTEFAPNGDLATDIAALNAFHNQLHQPVVKEKPISWLNHLRQRLEAHRYPFARTNNVLARQCELDGDGLAVFLLVYFKLAACWADCGAEVVAEVGSRSFPSADEYFLAVAAAVRWYWFAPNSRVVGNSSVPLAAALRDLVHEKA